MAFSRNEILKAWDEVVSNFEDPNESEIACGLGHRLRQIPRPHT